MTPEPVSGERRCALRIPVSLQAVLYCHTLTLPDCVISDISADGLFVRTGGQGLPEGAAVDLVLSGGGARRARVSADVVRVTDAGVGLRLRYGDPLEVRALVDMLYAA